MDAANPSADDLRGVGHNAGVMFMRSMTADGLRAHFARLAAATEPTEAVIARTVADNAVGHIKRVFGDLNKLTTLAESTQAERVRQGYTANDPLKRSGELRDSITSESAGSISAVGSTDPKMPWLEYGTHKMPARPAIGIGTHDAAADTLVIVTAGAQALATGNEEHLLAMAELAEARKAAS